MIIYNFKGNSNRKTLFEFLRFNKKQYGKY